MGFKRLSFTLQDVDPVVQPAVSPAWPFGQVRELVREAQALGFASVHVDLVYALPQQAPEAFVRTLAQLAELRPTRIALLAHAHLPQRFNAQRRGSEAHWPSAAQHLQMRRQAGVSLVGHGYCDIGMDLFSWPGDALAVAKRQGRLHRNFNGYTTLPDGDRIGLGVAALGCMGATCSRNAKTLAEYHDALAQGELPVVQGLALTRDDVLRRAVIMALVCQGWVDFESIEVAHLVRMREYFAPEFERLKPLQSLGLVQVNEREIQVTTAGWFSVRAVAMVFDRHLQADRARQRFSRII